MIYRGLFLRSLSIDRNIKLFFWQIKTGMLSVFYNYFVFSLKVFSANWRDSAKCECFWPSQRFLDSGSSASPPSAGASAGGHRSSWTASYSSQTLASSGSRLLAPALTAHRVNTITASFVLFIQSVWWVSALWFHFAGSIKKYPSVLINYQLIALIRQQSISVLQFSNDWVQLGDLQLESPQVPFIRLLRNMRDRRRGGKQNLKKREHMQVGGQVTEVNGEEELDGWDAISQHKHYPVGGFKNDTYMNCWWHLDMKVISHITVWLSFLSENKISLIGIDMFYCA